MRSALVVLAAALLVGSLTLEFRSTQPAVAPEQVEVRLAPLASGSSGGLNFSDASASVAGTLLSTSSDVLYLNNTNATGAWYVRLVETGSTGVSNLVALSIGIHNGTATTPQVTASLGSLTQTTGALVRLEPGATGRILVQRTVSIAGPDTVLPLALYAYDDATQSAYVATDVRITVT